MAADRVQVGHTTYQLCNGRQDGPLFSRVVEGIFEPPSREDSDKEQFALAMEVLSLKPLITVLSHVVPDEWKRTVEGLAAHFGFSLAEGLITAWVGDGNGGNKTVRATSTTAKTYVLEGGESVADSTVIRSVEDAELLVLLQIAEFASASAWLIRHWPNCARAGEEAFALDVFRRWIHEGIIPETSEW